MAALPVECRDEKSSFGQQSLPWEPLNVERSKENKTWMSFSKWKRANF